MKKFTNLKSIPAYLPIVNIDTDMIILLEYHQTHNDQYIQQINHLHIDMLNQTLPGKEKVMQY